MTDEVTGFPLPLERDLTFRDSDARLVPAVDPDPELLVPKLGISRGPKSLSLINVPVETGAIGTSPSTKYYFARPCLLIPASNIFPSAPGTFTNWDIYYSPVDPMQKAFYLGTGAGDTLGFRTANGCIHIWAPG